MYHIICTGTSSAYKYFFQRIAARTAPTSNKPAGPPAKLNKVGEAEQARRAPVASGIGSRLRSAAQSGRPDAGSSSDEELLVNETPRGALPSDEVRRVFYCCARSTRKERKWHARLKVLRVFRM